MRSSGSGLANHDRPWKRMDAMLEHSRLGTVYCSLSTVYLGPYHQYRRYGSNRHWCMLQWVLGRSYKDLDLRGTRWCPRAETSLSERVRGALECLRRSSP